MEPGAPGIALNNLDVLFHLNVWMPSIIFTFSSTSTVSAGRRHLR